MDYKHLTQLLINLFVKYGNALNIAIIQCETRLKKIDILNCLDCMIALKVCSKLCDNYFFVGHPLFSQFNNSC